MGGGGGSVRRAAAALLWVLVLAAAGCGSVCEAQLRHEYYDGVCPNVESIVRGVVAKKIQQTLTTVSATVRLFFHDCFVEGCDASVMVASTANNTAEKDHPINLSLAGDGFDTVIRARAALDAVPGCRRAAARCLAMATRDAIALAGGPSYAVELGRLDGLRSTVSSVNGKLPAPFFNLDLLNQMFAVNGLSQADVVALSGLTRRRPEPRRAARSGSPTMSAKISACSRGCCTTGSIPRCSSSLTPARASSGTAPRGSSSPASCPRCLTGCSSKQARGEASCDAIPPASFTRHSCIGELRVAVHSMCHSRPLRRC